MCGTISHKLKFIIIACHDKKLDGTTQECYNLFQANHESNTQ